MLSQKVGEDQKKKGLRRKSELIRKNQTEERFGLDHFISQKMLSKPFHEEINRAKRPCGPHKTASRAKCGPRVGQPWFNGYENNYLRLIYCLK